MKGRILVAYASRYGSTKEVAESVAGALREAGLEVDCRDMREVDAVEDYRAFVLGAPFYFGRWLRPARRFLDRFGPVLAHRDVAVFGTGQIDAAHQPAPEVRAQMDSLAVRYDWLHPFDIGVFGGSYTPDRLSGWHRWLLRLPASPLRGIPASDLRDWQEVRSWADGVARTLKAHVAQPIRPVSEPVVASRGGAPFELIREYVADQQRFSRLRKGR